MIEDKDYSVNRYRLVDQVYDIIKDQIITGRLSLGEEISIDEFSKKLNTSKTPIREALHKLIGEGLVENDINNKKMKIINLDLQEISNICDLRQVLEVLALKEGFLKISKDKLVENKQMLKESEIEIGKNIFSKFHLADDQLHKIIIDSANNKWLVQIMSKLGGLIQILKNTYPSTDRFKVSIFEHINIIDHILNGNKKKAVTSLNLHLENSKDRIINSVNKYKI
jgi:GntR family transcriptional regulator, rspAB operon transcriptional repressor